MIFEVFLTDDALHDLEDIDDYICAGDSPQKADYVLQKIEKVFQTLVDSPKRGSYPKELLEQGIRDYREVYFKPYRVIYRVQEKRVYIYMIADGRRDMQSLLTKRLLGA